MWGDSKWLSRLSSGLRSSHSSSNDSNYSSKRRALWYLLHRSRPLNNPFDNCCAFGDLVEKRGLIQKQPQQATTRRASHKAKEARIYAGISMVNWYKAASTCRAATQSNNRSSLLIYYVLQRPVATFHSLLHTENAVAIATFLPRHYYILIGGVCVCTKFVLSSFTMIHIWTTTLERRYPLDSPLHNRMV